MTRYLLYDEEMEEFHGEYDSIEEAIECAVCLRDRDYYLTTSIEEGRKIVLDTDEMKKALIEYWKGKEG